MNQLISSVKPLAAITTAAGAAGTSVLTSAIIDTKSLEGVLFLIVLGPIVAGAATSLKLQHGNDSAMSDAADVLGSNQTIADTEDNNIRYLDLRRPIKRYVTMVFSRATQNATVSVVALPYGARNQPVAQTALGAKLVSPISGAP